jgi:hypothetical protein
LALFLSTASTDPETLSADTRAAAIGAWALAETGGLAVTPEVARTNHWIVVAPDGDRVSNRQPGVIAAGVPAYWLARPFTEGFSLVPMAVTSAVVATLAVGCVLLLLLQLGAPRREAEAFVVLGALGSATWSVAADALWTHGPAILALSAGLLLAARRQHLLAGCALAAAVPVRTHLVVVCFTVGVGAAVAHRRWTHLVRYGVPSAAALLGVATYTWWLFGAFRLDAGYTAFNAYPTANVTALTPSSGRMLLDGLLAFAFSPDRGLLLTTPVLLPLVLVLPAAWRRAGWLARASALGALAYLAVQAKLNHFSGGGHFWGSRLTLEALFLTVPLWWEAWKVTEARWGLRRMVLVLAPLGIAMHAVGAAVFTPGDTPAAYRHWWVRTAAQDPEAGLTVKALILSGCLAALVVLLATRRAPAVRPEPALDPTATTATAA